MEKTINFQERRVATTTIGVYPEQLKLLEKIKNVGLFRSKSEIFRYCFNACLPKLIDMLDKFADKEYVEVDGNMIRIVRRL